jgi:hypothetical protein
MYVWKYWSLRLETRNTYDHVLKLEYSPFILLSLLAANGSVCEI